MKAVREESKNEERLANYFVPDCQLLTIGTFGQESILADDAVIHTLRVALTATKTVAPFENVAFVFLPDHLHLLLKPGAGINADAIVGDLTHRFQHDYWQLMGQPSSERLFLHSYERRSVRNEKEFADTLDYVHYDPVHHRLAKRPEEWLHSSYQNWVERGVYKLGWGWRKPNTLQ